MNADWAAAFAGDVWLGDTWCGRDFRGRRVAVIASGADATWAVPKVVATAARTKVFLEDPGWVLPRLPTPLSGSARAAFAVPVAGPLARRLVARAHLRSAVKDPWVRRLLTPDDRFARHHAAFGGGFYAALQDPRCTLVRWPVYAITADGVRSAEGVEHRVDSLIIPDPARHSLQPSLGP
ncbi:hypothetical protein [Nocardioides limicola]|uniref:hypothetical protein n=1 Tax=Nocardioides limicola TaxID=2803368 RepID=UPI00193BEA5C|nr:hypothetical protein [Nocardioides sp. DJM-14]